MITIFSGNINSSNESTSALLADPTFPPLSLLKSSAGSGLTLTGRCYVHVGQAHQLYLPHLSMLACQCQCWH